MKIYIVENQYEQGRIYIKVRGRDGIFFLGGGGRMPLPSSPGKFSVAVGGGNNETVAGSAHLVLCLSVESNT